MTMASRPKQNINKNKSNVIVKVTSASGTDRRTHLLNEDTLWAWGWLLTIFVNGKPIEHDPRGKKKQKRKPDECVNVGLGNHERTPLVSSV